MKATLGFRGMLGVIVVALCALAACGPTRARVEHGLAANSYFLCCTLRFNADQDASDAGYAYEKGTTLPAGTSVRVVREDDQRITFQPAGGNEQYGLVFRYGRNAISAGQFFQEVLLREDPRPRFARSGPEVADAIARGELRVGMTKAEAIAARGYPPRHRTGSIDADEWIYYQDKKNVLRVRFESGILTSITPDRAPGS